VLAPGDPRGHNNLDTLAEAGRVDEALPEFEESVELNPQRRRWGESGEYAGRQGRAPGGSHSTIESLRRQTASYQLIARICQKDGRTRSQLRKFVAERPPVDDVVVTD
jgi:hypothetical protein